MNKCIPYFSCLLFILALPLLISAHNVQKDTTIADIKGYDIAAEKKAELYFKFALKHKVGFPWQAIHALDLATEIYTEANALQQVAEVQSQKAQILTQKELYIPAILYFLKAYKTFDEANLLSSKAWLLVNIGNIYFDLEQYNTAKAFYSKASVIFSNIKEYFGLSVCMLNFGLINEKLNKQNDAMYFYRVSKKIRSNLPDPYLTAHINYYIARVYFNMGLHEEAIKFLFESNKIIKSTTYTIDEITQQLCKNYLLLAHVYEAQKKTDMALSFADTALLYARSNFDTLNIINILIFKGNNYLSYNKNNEVLASYNKALALSDSLKNTELKKQILLLQIKHSIKQKDLSNTAYYFNLLEKNMALETKATLMQKNKNLSLAIKSFFNQIKLDEAKVTEKYNNFVIFFLTVIFIIIICIVLIFFYYKNRLWKSNKLILDSAFDGIILHKNGVIYDINTSFQKFTGYSLGDLKNKNVHEIFSSESYYTIFKNTALSGNVFDFSRIKLKNNTWIDVEVEAKPVVYRGKNMRIVTIRDITERLRSETQIHLFRTIIEQSFSAIVITNTQGNIEYVNPSFSKLTGYSFEEVIDKNPRILKSGHHPIEFYNDMWHTISSGNAWMGNIRNKNKNGQLFWEETIITPIKDANGHIIKYAAIKRDITKRKQLEDDIKLLNNQLKMVFESIDAYVFVLDFKTDKILFANQGATASFGDITNKHINDVIFNEESQQFLNIPKIELLKKRTATTSHSSHTEEVFLKTSGRWYEFTSRIITWVNKENAILLMAYDITDRKNTISLLNELNATKDKFFSIIAHDLRNPFQGLLGFVEILSSLPDYNDTKMVKMLLSNIESASKNAYTLLENLLQWANLQKGNVKLNKTAFSLNNLVNEAIKLLLPLANNKNIALNNKISTSIEVFADANACQTILYNLLSNAIKFTPDNGYITVNATLNEKFAEITITDTGIGIPQEMLPVLFRIDTKYSILGTRGEKGTGLGLILCKELVELNGGNIYAESQFKKGSTFTFTIPVNISSD